MACRFESDHPHHIKYIMIENSLQWAKCRAKLVRITYDKIENRDNKIQLYKLIDNVDKSVKKLSIAEIQIRHGNNRDAIEQLKIVNQDIEMIEEYLLVAVLSG